MKVNSTEILAVNNGMVSPKVPIHINGVTMTPGVSFSGGVSFGGVDLTQYVGKVIEVDVVDGVYHIKGYYQ